MITTAQRTYARRLVLGTLSLLAVTTEAARGAEPLTGMDYVYGMSADGSVVVGRVELAEGEGAGYWSNGVATLLDPLPSGIRADRVTVVSPDGSVMAGYGPAFRYDGVSMVEIVPPDGGSNTYPAAISDDGSIVVAKFSTAGGHRVLRWAAGVATEMALPPGTSECEPIDASADGAVIVGACGTPTGTVTFRWDDGGTITLAPNSGFAHCAPVDVSDDGAVIVGTCNNGSNDSSRAYRWESGAVSLLPTSGEWSTARCISADGAIIVGRSANCVYRYERGESTCLEELADAYTGSTLQAVQYGITGCSDDGLVLVAEAVAYHSDGGFNFWWEYGNWLHNSFEGWSLTCGTWNPQISGDGGSVVHGVADGPNAGVWFRCETPRTDCDSNGLGDDAEIAANSALDCNYDHILNACQPVVDCNGNTTPDSCDIASGQSEDCNADGVPDECDPGGFTDCNNNGRDDACEIAYGTSADCNANGVPDGCDVALPGADCNANGVPDSCDAALPNGDCNANGIPDDCDAAAPGGDCNANGVPDSCDIAAGTSQDCPPDGIPDECDPLFEDCNANGLDDRCDLFTKDSMDCNHNHVPDECDVADGMIDCNDNSIPDACELSSAYYDWLMPEVREVGARFGNSLVLHGDEALIGAFNQDVGYDEGAVHVFRQHNGAWKQADLLHPPTSLNFSEFGSCVARSGDVAIVGDPFHYANGFGAGAAHIYRRDTGGQWVREQMLLPSTPRDSLQFGNSVAIEGDVAVVGCGPEAPLAVWEHTSEGWVQSALIQADSGASYYYASLDIDGGRIAVGAWQSAGKGLVYMYAKSPDTGQWQRTATLVGHDTDARDDFGKSVDILDDLLIVGAPNAGPAISDHGAAYLFRESDDVPGTWVEEAKLAEVQPANNHLFGNSVAIGSGIVAVSAPKRNVGFTERAGSVYVFEYDGVGWRQRSRIDHPRPATNKSFGAALSVDGRSLLIGVAEDDSSRGTAYFFYAEADCDGGGAIDACELAAGTASDCNSNGLPDRCEITAGLPDCNANGSLDSCEVADGYPDCDGNAIPDDCDADCDGNAIVDACEGLPSFTWSGDDGLALTRCLSGPWLAQGHVHPDCLASCRAAFDADDDGDIDLMDFSALQIALGD